jgi:diguanylate cyclase (GGDEF)-like protein
MVCCVVYGLLGVLVLLINPCRCVFPNGLVLVAIVGFLGASVAWWFGSWPPERRSALFIVFVDAALTVYLFVGDPVVSLGLLNLFVVPTVYVTFVHGPKLMSAQLGYLFVVIVATYTYAIVWTELSVAVATILAVTAVSAGMSTNILAQIALTFLRRDARESFTDALTGVLNRRGLSEALVQSHAVYPPWSPMTAFVVDIDKFKSINDAHGHMIGDVVLTDTANCLAELCRGVDALARIGGDEFAIFAHLNAEQARAFAERIRRTLTSDTGTACVSVSIGTVTTFIASWPPADGDIVDEMIGYADAAMYRAKNAGGNRIVAVSM